MDFLITAQNMEKAGIEYYSNLASTTTIKELSGIFTFLADQEKEHLKKFEDMGKNGGANSFDGINIIEETKKIFTSLADQFDTIKTDSFDRKEIYEKAHELENKSINFYRNELEKLENNEQIDILNQIISEEEKHANIIMSIIDFQEHPREWLENAEWNHLDQY